ncbi:MAG TPA: hypothetical protein VM115_12510 [Vicinamibacterales bacterium]|nr:hypothetical protein [Vicinamibacterales bacterium]
MMRGICAIVVLVMFAVASAPVSAQRRSNTETGIDVAASIEVVNQYVFRGVPQNSDGIAMWPAIDVGVTVHSGDGLLKRVRVGGGFLSSFHTGDTGSGGPTGKAWYESRVSGSVGMHFAGNVLLETGYTSFTSPNDMFTSVKEVSVKGAIEGRRMFGGLLLDPYALAAFELGADPGEGQLDGGRRAGKYLELGIEPKYAIGRVTLSTPVAVGLSMSDYYEIAMQDHAFGFTTIAGTVAVPLRRSPTFGSLSVRGSVQYGVLGTTTKAFNAGDRSFFIGSLGVVVSH